MKNLAIALALLILAFSASTDAAVRDGALKPNADSRTTSDALELKLPEDGSFFRNFKRSDMPLGANAVSAARSVLAVEKLRRIDRVKPLELPASGTFGRLPSGAALALLLVALLLLPFMGKTEAR